MNPETAATAREGWPWPDSLDACVAAPRHHLLRLENDRVRVLETTIPPGEIVPLHTHRWPGLYHVLSWSDFIRRDGDGNVLFDSRTRPAPPAAPFVQWSEPLPPHTLENIGNADLHILSVELKD
jgi:hypothetical protein